MSELWSSLTDAEIAEKLHSIASELARTGGKSFRMSIPARPNEDTDLLISEGSRRITTLTADRDRWKALAVEAGERLKDSEDYLTESLNNVLDDSRPRYERHRQLIRDDIAENNKVLKKLQEAGE